MASSALKKNKNDLGQHFNPADDQYFGMPYWAPNGQFWVQWMNRGEDDLIIYNIDLATGAKTSVYEEKQSTWIDLDDNDRVAFLPSSKGFIVRSDKTGWRHLYRYDMNGKLLNAITQGEYTTGDILKLMKGQSWYISMRAKRTRRGGTYTAPAWMGKTITRLSTGNYSYTGMNISPGGKYFITSYSNISTPATTVVMDMKGKVVRETGNMKGTEYDNYALPKKELVRVKSTDVCFNLPGADYLTRLTLTRIKNTRCW